MAERPVTLHSVGEVLRSAGLLTETRGPGDVAVMGVSQDSRQVRPGDLFLAWEGTAFDAHDFVAEAAERGAAAAVVEHPVDAEIPQVVVTNGRGAAALAADHVMGSPWRDLHTVGVTGTNGKSTTAVLARHLLARRGPAAVIGTLGVMDTEGVRPGTEALTTPGPVQVAVWLRDLADGGVQAVVIEASSHALEQRRLDGVRFDVGVFTNLSQDHLDYHQDSESYFGAKARLVGLVSPDGTVVVNRDDPAWADLDTGGRAVRTFAVDHDSDIRATQVVLGPDGSSFTLTVDGNAADVQLPLLGGYNVENALAAAAVASCAGMSVDEIALGLQTAPQVPGRLEIVEVDPFRVVIDFAHTPDALDGVLAAVRPLTARRLIVVFGAGGDRDRTKRGPMGEAVARYADEVFLTSDNPRTENPESILDDVAEGLSGKPFHRSVDRREAIRGALGSAASGDTVVLAGKGHETYQVIGLEKRPFDERIIVRECLQELRSS
jgi:UDP-N-acetylmuramoyl-L-alanyl-D-glutamate--2,6-diaminopimelate ligase